MPQSYFLRALALTKQGDIEGAIYNYCQAVSLDRSYGQAYNNMALLLLQQGKIWEAEVMLRQAIELNGADGKAHHNLALVFMEKGDLTAARDCFIRALQCGEESSTFYNNWGLYYWEIGCSNAAEAAFCQAISLDEIYVEAYYNLANLLREQQRVDEAEQYLIKAVTIAPAYKEAQFALSLIYLLQGRFQVAWPLYESFRMKHSGHRPPLPLWQGEALRGKRVLLFYEQGFGDTFQFLRFAPLLAAQASEISLWLPEAMRGIQLLDESIPLYYSSSVTQQRFDFCCPLPSLPAVLKIDEATIPRTVPYLAVSTDLQEKWRLRLAAEGRPEQMRIGFVWAGNPQHHNDRNRSIPAELFRPLLLIKNTEWISLQIGPRSNEGAGLPAFLDFTSELTDFSQTAALISQLDLVVTVDSAVAHLAGALGKKTWVCIPYDPDWRWQYQRTDSPWYPSIKLFRQQQPGIWENIIACLQQEIIAETGKK
ncbi:MAG: tetratricopeptide repeat protein [Sporomusaceae bacterium]|nr:tetratricopeptide repeat protein [Sporomusaceae bacterium]